MNYVQPWEIQPGTIVSVRYSAVIDHVGLVTDRYEDGLPTVFSNSKRRGSVIEESWFAFCDGKQVSVVGYPGRLSADEVLARARSRRGSSWRLLDSNCEHFVSWAHGMAPESPQVKRGIGAAIAFWAIRAVLGA